VSCCIRGATDDSRIGYSVSPLKAEDESTCGDESEPHAENTLAVDDENLAGDESLDVSIDIAENLGWTIYGPHPIDFSTQLVPSAPVSSSSSIHQT
jgi:hypothetical protein